MLFKVLRNCVKWVHSNENSPAVLFRSTIVILFFSNKVGEICMGSKLWQAIKSKRDNLLKPV